MYIHVGTNVNLFIYYGKHYDHYNDLPVVIKLSNMMGFWYIT